MRRYMLDTDTCIYIIKNYPEKLRERFNQSASELCISSITLGELRFGAEKSARRADNLREVAAFVGRLEVLPFGEEAAAHFGDIRASLERAGRPAGAYDMLIGGHARSEGLVVVTNNRREFERMPGLNVENWI
ncbi:MAG: type II toxin-antitoxin system VapC family toxin [Parvularculaceae bacterium]